MYQNDLDRAVARATGESVATIKRLGFLLAEPVEPDAEESGPYIIDWDEIEARRDDEPTGRPHHVPAAA